MGCNCGRKAQTMSYKFTGPTGQVKIYNTEIEAKAAKIRQGGGSYVVVPK